MGFCRKKGRGWMGFVRKCGTWPLLDGRLLIAMRLRRAAGPCTQGGISGQVGGARRNGGDKWQSWRVRRNAGGELVA